MAEKLVFKIEAVNKKFNDAIKDASAKTENLEQNLSAVTRTAGLAFTGLSATIGGFLSQAIKIEEINTQFEVLTGSVLGAEKAVAQLQDLSASTPFAFEDVARAGKQLLGFGFQVDELSDRLNELGDVAAASGAPISDLTLIYGQVAAAGKLTGERLLQLQERAIPIGPALAKTLGVAETAVKDLVTQGKIDFETFQTAFQSLSKEGGFAFGGLEKQSKTLGGQLSTLKDNFSLVASELGEQFLPAAKEVTGSLISLFQTIREDKELQDLIVTGLKVATVFTGIVTAVGGLALVFTKIAIVAGPVVGALGAIAGAVASLPVAIGGLVAAVIGLVASWDSNLSIVENITVNFAERIKAIFSGIGSVLKGAFTLDRDLIKEGLAEIELAFAESGENIKEKRKELAEQRRLEAEQELEEERIKLQRLQEQELEAIALKNEAKKEAEAAAKAAEITAEQKQQAKLLGIQLEGAKNRAQAQKKIDEAKVKAEGETLSRIAILSRSNNKTLAAIGKAAALKQIAIEAPKGVSKALAAFPPPFNFAAAAAVGLAFAEQARNVIAAQDGGLITGAVKGRDSVPAVLQPGELVTPERNFDEVVNAVADQRNRQRNQAEQASGSVQVELTLRDELVEFVEARIIERGKLNTGLGLA